MRWCIDKLLPVEDRHLPESALDHSDVCDYRVWYQRPGQR